MEFDVAADAYDRYMGAWSRELAPKLVDLVAVRPGMRVLDVGCGPGAVVAALLDRLEPGAIAAVDPSVSFVGAVRGRYPGVDVRPATAEALPYPDATFDIALAQLVVHFMQDPVAGLREMARVTRPGGLVAACVWDFAGGRGPLGPFWEAVRVLDPGAVDESELPGARGGHLAELLVTAGLRQVKETALTCRREYAGFDDWWRPFTEGVGPGGSYLAGLPRDRQAALRERCRSMLSGGPFALEAWAWAAHGNV